MGKKRKEDKEGNETYEVWISKIDGTWSQAVEKGNDGIFNNKQRALLIGASKSNDKDVIETLVIERRPIASFNGPAISVKGQVRAGQLRALPEPEKKKEEKTDGDLVHGDRPEAGPGTDPEAQRKGEADPSGAGREAAAGQS